MSKNRKLFNVLLFSSSSAIAPSRTKEGGKNLTMRQIDILKM